MVKKKNDTQDKSKLKTRRRTQPIMNHSIVKSNNHQLTNNSSHNKTLRKGSIVTNRTHTTVFFS